ncbi:MAG: arginine deiminase family protein [Paludibacteraceae bacterium]|nr:arginine deiminase family protein [Paludibacteraceae bacterium]
MKRLYCLCIACVSLCLMAQRPLPYFTVPEMPNALHYLPAPPQRGDIRFAHDSVMYLWGKSMRNTPRGEKARLDAEFGIKRMAEIFSPIMGVDISPTNTPQLWKLLSEATYTASFGCIDAKKEYMRPRPYMVYYEPTLVPEEEAGLLNNGSYPSGHTTLGWTTALVLCEINPAAQDTILKEGYEYGQSRVIAGFHWQSDVDAARVVSSASFARLHTSPAYLNQLQQAQQEYNRLRSAHGQCSAALTSYAYPTAEWDTARVILMHTPGIELFDGVVHPTAGLFEHYFDVDKAAQEHRGYIRQLEANGIQVITLQQVLQQMPSDTLRRLAEQVLVYDTKGLSAADTATNGEAYRRQTLQEMSREDLIRVLLLQPTVHLTSVDNNTGIEATYEHQPLMNLYFMRDQSITTPRGHVICNMNSLQRRRETDLLRAVYRQLGTPAVYEVTGDGRLEGGDYIPAGTVAFIGCGMRTNMEAIQQMLAADAFGHDTVVVVRDHKFWQMQMHLDTHFNIIDSDLCTMVASRLNALPGDSNYVTADVYARAPNKKHYRLIAKNVGFADLLRQRGFTIIPIEQSDEMHDANNFLTIAPRHIMAVAGQSQSLQQSFRDNGVTVEWVPLESLIDGYGAAHCMTQVLRR